MRDRPRGQGAEAAPPADTRSADGPPGRLYAAPFARVWDAIPSVVARRRLWRVVHADEELGLATIVCRLPISGIAGDLSVWVRLDDNGLTRGDARAGARGRWTGPRAARRRLDRFLAGLDRAVGPDARIRT